MNKLKHVIVATDFAFVNGGQTQVAIDSALRFAEAGLGVTYFAASGPVDARLAKANLEVVCLDQNDILSDPNRARAALRGLWNREAAGVLSKLCQTMDRESTVLHCHGFAKALSPSVGPILTDGPIRSLFTMHEFFLACPNGGFYDYRMQEICQRRALGPSCITTNCDVRNGVHKAWRLMRQGILIGPGKLPRRLRDITYISRIQKEIMRPYLSENTRLHYVPNPVPSQKSVPLVDSNENQTFLFVGRLSPEKGGLLFARAAKRAGVRAVFVGDGEQHTAIQKANPNATITGWLDRDAVAEWISHARCLVFPSVWFETFGLVVYEALQRGVPVICGAWSAASDAIRNGETGLLVSSPDVESFASAISELTDDEHPVFSRIKAIETSFYSPAQHTEKLLDIYEGILAQGN